MWVTHEDEKHGHAGELKTAISKTGRDPERARLAGGFDA